jgi:hypothetical protein
MIAKITKIKPAMITIGEMNKEIKPLTSFSKYIAVNPPTINSIAKLINL